MNEEAITIEEKRRMNLVQARNGVEEVNQATERQHQEKQDRRINPVEAGLMIGVSFIFDAAQALLGFLVIGIALNFVISVVAWLTFFLWFHTKGISYGLGLKGGLSTAKNPMVINAAALLIGFIPILNILPERTVAIIAIIALEYAGRFAKGSVTGKLLEKVHAA